MTYVSVEKRRATRRKWYLANKERELNRNKEWAAANSEKVSTYKKAYRENLADVDTARYLHQIAKSRAKRNGLTFDLDLSDIEVPSLCPVFNTPLQRNSRYPASIDRVDSSKGYEKDNIQVISRKANAMKQDATPEELLLFADWIYKTYGQKPSYNS